MAQAAATENGVIIHGESGTGKELVARAIHNADVRKDAEFVPINCGAIPENLLESEFFGRKKGAFSGASTSTHGYLDLANNGTLFLDEVGELSLEMQVKLLRAIEGQGYYPVGDTQLRHSNFRLVSATNRNIRQMVENGEMREDFYYRIHIIPIHLPPLRERLEDLPLLVEHYLQVFSAGGHKNVLPNAALNRLMRHSWPGNIRELQNVLRRFLATGRIELHPLSKELLRAPVAEPLTKNQPATLAARMDQHERMLIKEALDQNRWHRGQTAKNLGIDRRTLYSKMKIHGFLKED
jgi:transcriptional regulator with PAS, ATPase and Fis domain